MIMSEEGSTKGRNKNFSPQELEMLVNEVQIRKDVLFAKFSMTVTTETKKKGWQAVASKVSFYLFVITCLPFLITHLFSIF